MTLQRELTVVPRSKTLFPAEINKLSLVFTVVTGVKLLETFSLFGDTSTMLPRW